MTTGQIVAGIIILLLICGLDSWQNSRNGGNKGGGRGPGNCGESSQYKGCNIKRMANGKYQVTGKGAPRSFESELKAKQWIDQQ